MTTNIGGGYLQDIIGESRWDSMVRRNGKPAHCESLAKTSSDGALLEKPGKKTEGLRSMRILQGSTELKRSQDCTCYGIGG
jgi:hypothetical protein